MSPPPTPNMTPEQLQQQKIMKVMMVVLFPLMLYKAPSGLTLYIFTSSCIGILESRYIRQHITELELNPPKPRDPGDKKPKDRLARMWADKLEAARAKRAQQQQGQRSFKKRK
jgi:membrane protein insertase Oxa1/YidC/SpoIIIJ